MHLSNDSGDGPSSQQTKPLIARNPTRVSDENKKTFVGYPVANNRERKLVCPHILARPRPQPEKQSISRKTREKTKMGSNAAFYIFTLLMVLSASGVASSQNCAVSYRRDCGVVGTTEVRNDTLTNYCIIMSSVCPSFAQDQCRGSGCCWSPTDDGTPWCFYPGCSDPFNWNGAGIGFTDSFLANAKTK